MGNGKLLFIFIIITGKFLYCIFNKTIYISVESI